MDGLDDLKFNCTRRHFLSAASLGIGSTALAALLDPSLLAAGPRRRARPDQPARRCSRRRTSCRGPSASSTCS